MAWGLIGMNSKAGGGGSSADGKTLLAIPSVTVEGTAFTYDGNEHGPTVGAYDEELIQAVGTKKTNAGEYNVVFSLRDTEHYAWEDGTIENKAVAWSIAKARVAIPNVTDTSKTYNRSAQSPTISSYDTALITVTGNSQTNVGSYKVTMSLADPTNYMWSDRTTTNKTVSWSIAVLKLAKPTASTTSFAYDGKAKTLSVSNYNSTYMTQSGTVSATASGSYTATYALKDKTNTQWADGSTANVSIGWTIGKIKLTAAQSTFSQSGALTYTGSAQSPTISGYSATYHTVSGNSGTNAGSYTAKVALKDTNHAWSDGTTAAKKVTWSIGKAAGSLTLSKSSISLAGTTSTASATFTVTRTGDGAITVASSNTGVATVSLSGTTVTVKGKATGSATITVKVAAGTNHTAPSNKTVSVSVTIYSATIGNCTPAQIKEAIQKGVHATIWNVGDVGPAMKITNWATDKGSVSGTYYPLIIGFDHNVSVETANKKSIHFSLARNKSSGHDIGMAGTYMAPIPAGASEIYSWNNSSARSQLKKLSSDGHIDEAWNTVIASIKKYTKTKSDDNSILVSATSDKFWLLSEFEVFGSCTYSHTVEKEQQKRYAYYANGNSRVRYNDANKAVGWWLRSPHKTDDTTSGYYNNSKLQFVYNEFAAFCNVSSEGTAGNTNCTNVAGVTMLAIAPCFAITA